jgi:Ca2+-binding RTX toxin-like protein
MGLRKIVGTNAAETINGTSADEDIKSLGGNDTVDGGAGNDRIDGGDGNDILLGGLGNDRLRGDHGNDILTGGEGRDRFVFNLQGGVDHVTDYTDGQDRLDFTNFGFATVADLLSHATQVGTDVVFSLPTGVTVILDHVNLSVLGGRDFII